MSPTLTEDRVKVIVNDALDKYEITVGSVRHSENLAEFKKIAATLNKQAGSFTTIKIIGSILACIATLTLLLLGYLGTHRQNSSMITTDHFTMSQR